MFNQNPTWLCQVCPAPHGYLGTVHSLGLAMNCYNVHLRWTLVGVRSEGLQLLKLLKQSVSFCRVRLSIKGNIPATCKCHTASLARRPQPHVTSQWILHGADLDNQTKHHRTQSKAPHPISEAFTGLSVSSQAALLHCMYTIHCLSQLEAGGSGAQLVCLLRGLQRAFFQDTVLKTLFYL